MSWAIPFLALLGPWVWFVSQVAKGNAVRRGLVVRFEIDVMPFLLATRRVAAAMNEMSRRMAAASRAVNAANSARIQAEIDAEIGDILGDR